MVCARRVLSGGGVRLSLYRAMEKLPDQFRPPLTAIGALLRDVKYYSASQFTNPSLCPVSFEMEQKGPRRRGLRLRGHSRFLYDLYKARGSPSYEQFSQVIGQRGMGLVKEIVFGKKSPLLRLITK